MRTESVNDFETVDRLVNDNMALARYFAAKWSRTLGEDESFSSSMAGLLRAAQQWDETKAPFGVFASLCIKQELFKVYNRGKRVKRGGRVTHVSLDAPIGEDGNATVGELIADQSGQREVLTDESARLRSILSTLKERHAYIITRRFGLDGEAKATLDDLGRELGITRERVRQIETEALGKIRLRHGEKKAVRATKGVAQEYGRIGTDHGGYDPNAPESPPTASAKPRREATVEARAYFAAWRKANREYLTFLRHLNRDRIRSWKRQWHAANRDAINAKRRERYASDLGYAEGAKRRAKEHRDANQEHYRAQKAGYRQTHRQQLRDAQNARTAAVVPSYVREQLAKRTKRDPQSFSLDEIVAHREHILARREELKSRPRCPKCARPGRKDGFFRPSGNQRYSCRFCKGTYGAGGS